MKTKGNKKTTKKTTTVVRTGRKAGQGSNWIRRAKRLAIYARDGFRCAYCGRGVEDGVVLSLDHVLACELGGSNHESNLVTCCVSCNSVKQDKTTRQFFSMLRDRGIDTEKLGPKVRRLVAKPLDMKLGKTLLGAGY